MAKTSAKGGCSTKSGKLYIVRTPGKLTATKSKQRAAKMVATCRKAHKKGGVKKCSWTTHRK